jgi:hypothetical protein
MALETVRSDGSSVNTWSAWSALPVSMNDLWLAGKFTTDVPEAVLSAHAGSQPVLLGAEMEAMLDVILDSDT